MSFRSDGMEFESMGPAVSGLMGGAIAIVLCETVSRFAALLDAGARYLAMRRHRAINDRSVPRPA